MSHTSFYKPPEGNLFSSFFHHTETERFLMSWPEDQSNKKPESKKLKQKRLKRHPTKKPESKKLKQKRLKRHPTKKEKRIRKKKYRSKLRKLQKKKSSNWNKILLIIKNYNKVYNSKIKYTNEEQTKLKEVYASMKKILDD